MNDIINRAQNITGQSNSGNFGEYFFAEVVEHDLQRQQIVANKIMGNKAVGAPIRIALDPRVESANRPTFQDISQPGGKSYQAPGSVLFVQSATLRGGAYQARWLNRMADGVQDVFVLRTPAQITPEMTGNGKTYRLAKFLFTTRQQRMDGLEAVREFMTQHLTQQQAKGSLSGSGFGLQLQSLPDKQAALAVSFVDRNLVETASISEMVDSIIHNEEVEGLLDLIEGDSLWQNPDWAVNIIPASLKFFSPHTGKYNRLVESQYHIKDKSYWRDTSALFKWVNGSDGKRFLSLQVAAPAAFNAPYMPHAWEMDSLNLDYKQVGLLKKQDQVANTNTPDVVNQQPPSAA